MTELEEEEKNEASEMFLVKKLVITVIKLNQQKEEKNKIEARNVNLMDNEFGNEDKLDIMNGFMQHRNEPNEKKSVSSKFIPNIQIHGSFSKQFGLFRSSYELINVSNCHSNGLKNVV